MGILLPKSCTHELLSKTTKGFIITIEYRYWLEKSVDREKVTPVFSACVETTRKEGRFEELLYHL